jgi:DNA-directed RNA polymerase subunit RPC12/RpoP
MAETTFAITCPHCKKEFNGSPMEGTAARYRGFKCPHCKLFVPYERESESGLLDERPRPL